MKIALVSSEYPPETARGGIGTQTYLKAQGLAALGHEVYVISRSLDRQAHEYDDGAVHIKRIPGFDLHLPITSDAVHWLTYSSQVAVAVSSLHTRIELDLVDFPEWGGEGYIYLLNRTDWNYVPVVVQIHGPIAMFAETIGWPEHGSDLYRVGKEMEGTCLRLANAVFSSSDCSSDWCAKHYGLDRTKILRLHTGVDTQLFCPKDVPKSERPTIIFAGRISKTKGVDVLLEAALRMAADHPDLRLRMLGRGDGVFIDRLKQRALSADFPDLLDLPGFVPHEELPFHFSRAHVFAAPSIYEAGPGLVNLEAMACGLPVVASSGSGAAEVVLHEQNGLLARPGDVGSLEAALRRLLESPGARLAMGERARRYVETEASRETCLKQLESFYLSVAFSKKFVH